MKAKSQSLIGFPVDEKVYKVDLELQDRYTAYSAEILRLALLGIAGYGFLLKDLVFAEHSPTLFVHRAHDVWFLLIGGVICLGISAVLALQHRVCATDCVACVAAFIRKNACGRQDEAEADRAALRTNLKRAAVLLQFSALLLALGASSVVATFCYILWQ
ncbi:MAG: hypothetical protein PHY16_17330 [Methylobacter sp.]|nr:hypothetical protein [Methylobacter sp.]